LKPLHWRGEKNHAMERILCLFSSGALDHPHMAHLKAIVLIWVSKRMATNQIVGGHLLEYSTQD